MLFGSFYHPESFEIGNIRTDRELDGYHGLPKGISFWESRATEQRRRLNRESMSIKTSVDWQVPLTTMRTLSVS